jgi:hypothetical protein
MKSSAIHMRVPCGLPRGGFTLVPQKPQLSQVDNFKADMLNNSLSQECGNSSCKGVIVGGGGKMT